MRKQFLILVLALLPLGMFAQEQESAETEAPKKEKKSNAGKVFTGISGGMMLHAGYLFADDPTKVYEFRASVKRLAKVRFCVWFRRTIAYSFP